MSRPEGPTLCLVYGPPAVVASDDVLLERVTHAGRREHGKLGSTEDLRGFLAEYDLTSSIPGPTGPTIDTPRPAPAEAARIVAEHLETT